MGLLPLLAQAAHFLNLSKYPLFFLGSFFEGTAVMLAGGVFLKFGEVDFWRVYAALVGGDILSDFMWYFIGYFGARPFMLRWGYFLNATPDVIEKLERGFRRYQTRILVVSKMTMGLGIAPAILATAGMLRVSFARYCAINVSGSFVWVGFVVFIGYNFGNVLEAIPEQYQIALVALLVVAFFAGVRYVSGRIANAEW